MILRPSGSDALAASFVWMRVSLEYTYIRTRQTLGLHCMKLHVHFWFRTRKDRRMQGQTIR